MKKVNKWIQKTKLKKGLLHKQLGVKLGDKIPSGLLTDIASANIGTKVRGHKVTLKLKRRATFANNLRKIKRR